MLVIRSIYQHDLSLTGGSNILLGRNRGFMNFTGKGIQACFKRGTLKLKADTELTESCIGQGSVLRRNCTGHLSHNRKKGEEETKPNEKRAERKLSCSGLLNQNLLAEGNWNTANMAEVGVDVINIKRTVNEWNSIVVRTMGKESDRNISM